MLLEVAEGKDITINIVNEKADNILNEFVFELETGKFRIIDTLLAKFAILLKDLAADKVRFEVIIDKFFEDLIAEEMVVKFFVDFVVD